MANVLTNLAADMYRAADIVGRELVGIIPSATINGGTERAALGQTVRSFFTRPASVGTITPSMTIPEGTDQTVDNKSLAMSDTASVKIPWTGEDIKYVRSGAGWETIYGDQLVQAMRAITNQIELAAWNTARKAASRAHGTAGTTPFASKFDEVAEIRQILVDNGMPIDGMASLVLNTNAGTKLRNLASLQKVNESGGSELLRQGELLNLQGLRLKESAQVGVHTAGTGSGYLVDLVAGYAVGDTTIHVDTGTGTILAGDVITFEDDPNKYVVVTGFAGDGDGDITIGAPGLRKALANDKTVTIAAASTQNLAFHRNALEIAMRPYAQPDGGDAAVDSLVVQDPRSGLAFDVRAYRGYNKAMFDVQCVYGTKAWKGDYIALLLG